MRVTENTNYETVRESVRKSKSRMENLQYQNATLKKINTPSDDPVATAKILGVRTDKVLNEQFSMNSKLAQNNLNFTEQALGELGEIVSRAKEIALGQSSGPSANQNSRSAISEEVSQLFQNAVSIANRRVGDRYIFGGYKTDRAPVDPDGRYQGDSGQQLVEIARDVFLAMNLPGIDAFNTNPKNSSDAQAKAYGPELQQGGRTPATEEVRLNPDNGININVFDELQALRISLLTGDSHGIQSTLDRFDSMHARLTSMRAKLGARLQGLETAEQSNDRHNLINAQLTSSLEDADMAQVVSDLAKEETVFRSSLQSGQKLMQPTLLEFLK